MTIIAAICVFRLEIIKQYLDKRHSKLKDINTIQKRSTFNANQTLVPATNELNASPIVTSENDLLLDPMNSKQAQNNFKEAYKIIWWCALQVTICTSITSMVFPGVAQSTNLEFLSNSSSK